MSGPNVTPSFGTPQRGMPPQPAGPARIPTMPVQPIKKDDGSLDSISLVDEPTSIPGQPPAPSKIKAFGVAADHSHSTRFTRQPNVTGHGACRVRTFHGRMSDEGLAYLDDKINEWLDRHPEIEIKNVTTAIGQFDGKIKEPALIVNVWH